MNLSQHKVRDPPEPASSEGKRLPIFFTLTCGISWLIWLPLIATSQRWFDGEVPFVLYYVGTVGPALAAIILTAAYEGLSGVASVLRPLAKWRVSIWWYAVALLLPIVVRAAAFSVAFSFGYISPELSLRPWIDVLLLFALMLVLVPFEEIGWRGYALPRLQIYFSEFWASIILGVAWSLWHLPLVWVSGSYQESDSPLAYILIFTLTILPLSIIFTRLYNRTGSLLVVSLFHAVVNATEAALIIREQDGVLLLLAASVLYSAVAAAMILRTSSPVRLDPGN